MKFNNAFSMLEMIMVIVVIGILSISLIPRFESDTIKLYNAAKQVVSDIRYTQHLALQDDLIGTSDNWFKSRWGIRFYKNLTFSDAYCSGKDYYNIWSYTIFSDYKGSHTGNPDKDEIAKSPYDSNRLLSGGFNNVLCVENKDNTDVKSSPEMNLGIKYNIRDITFSQGCRSNITYIHFDYMGRPYNSNNKYQPLETASSGWHKLLTDSCVITLCLDNCDVALDNKKISIEIENMTGYVRIIK